MGSNPGEDMDVCKCIVPVWHGPVWLVEAERWDHPQGFLPSKNWSGTEQKRTVTCMVVRIPLDSTLDTRIDLRQRTTRRRIKLSNIGPLPIDQRAANRTINLNRLRTLSIYLMA
ncbi:hypothetical protein TNCV_49621 [Trichonephila clavipes]|nr:hypothetical protein TNCV_49621 [Trichonephila clavipes]